MGTDIGIGGLYGAQWIPMGRWGVVAGPRVAFEKGNLDEVHREAPFFVVVRWHGTCKQHFRSKIFAPRSWWSCSAPASFSRGAKVDERWYDFGLSLPYFSRWVLSRNR
jgi:hypothetical protein